MRFLNAFKNAFLKCILKKFIFPRVINIFLLKMILMYRKLEWLFYETSIKFKKLLPLFLNHFNLYLLC
jgi:hypothetical protein